MLLVVTNCGASLSENNTYFESEGEEDSHCSVQVCKGKDDIVQVTFFTDAFLRELSMTN